MKALQHLLTKKQPTPSTQLNTTEQPRLKLKDHIKLNNLKKKTNSTHEHLKKSEIGSYSSENKQNIRILKSELKNDAIQTSKRLDALIHAIDRIEDINDEEEECEELTFLCKLHRNIRQNLLANIQTSMKEIEERKLSLAMKLLIKTKGYADCSSKKQESPLKRKYKHQ